VEVSLRASSKKQPQAGEDLRQQTVQPLRVHPEVTKGLFQAAEQPRWRHADVLMTGGSVMSVAADGLLKTQKWLDEHLSVKALLNNTSSIVGTATWLKNFTPVGLLVG